MKSGANLGASVNSRGMALEPPPPVETPLVTVWHWDNKLSLEWAWRQLRDVFKFWEISDNISETVQDLSLIHI